MPLVNYVLITIEIRSELPLREAWRLTMIEWPLVLLDVYSRLLIISNNSWGSFIPVKVCFSYISHKGLLGTAGDRWGRLGTAGDGWGRLGTAGDAGDRWGLSFVTAFTYGKFINWP